MAAAGQLSAVAQTPFLTLCEAIMAVSVAFRHTGSLVDRVSIQYHLPSCMRLLEASHVVEILREAGPGGLHVQFISQKNGVAANKLGMNFPDSLLGFAHSPMQPMFCAFSLLIISCGRSPLMCLPSTASRRSLTPARRLNKSKHLKRKDGALRFTDVTQWGVYD